MSDNKGLAPVEQRQVWFYEGEITAVQMNDGSVLIPVRPLCENLGIDWSAQRRRIAGNPVLSEVTMSVVVTTTDIDESSRRPHTSQMLCLPLNYLNGWLFGVNADRVKPGIRDDVIRYQRNCYNVLAEAFREGRLITGGDGSTDFETQLKTADPNAVEAYNTVVAIMKLAKSHIMLEGWIESHERQLRFHGYAA